jgi:hypothetical protein
MLDPASKVLKHRQEIVDVNVTWEDYIELVELVHECHDLRQINQLRDGQALLFEQCA